MLCPLISQKGFSELQSNGQLGQYPTWQQGTGQYWDSAACTQQLPYHRLQAPGPTTKDHSWWLHVVNSGGAAVPRYRVRASCAPAPPCREPLLGRGPCSGHGSCESTQGAEALACKCEAGWTGAGCETPLTALALNRPTTVPGRSGADATEPAAGPTILPRGLYRVEVPRAAAAVVVELEGRWDSATLEAGASAGGLPRLCVSFDAEALLALTPGAPTPSKRVLCAPPTSSPLASHQGLTFPTPAPSATAPPTRPLYLLLEGPTPPAPLQLTARTPAANTTACPFDCSGHPDLCVASTATCSCPSGAGLGGSFCQHHVSQATRSRAGSTGSRSSRGSASTAPLSLPASGEPLLLAPGQSVWWLLAGVSCGASLRVATAAGQLPAPAAVEEVVVTAYRVEGLGRGPEEWTVRERCWQGAAAKLLQSTSLCPASTRSSHPPRPSHLALHIQNRGPTPYPLLLRLLPAAAPATPTTLSLRHSARRAPCHRNATAPAARFLRAAATKLNDTVVGGIVGACVAALSAALFGGFFGGPVAVATFGLGFAKACPLYFMLFFRLDAVMSRTLTQSTWGTVALLGFYPLLAGVLLHMSLGAAELRRGRFVGRAARCATAASGAAVAAMGIGAVWLLPAVVYAVVMVPLWLAPFALGAGVLFGVMRILKEWYPCLAATFRAAASYQWAPSSPQPDAAPSTTEALLKRPPSVQTAPPTYDKAAVNFNAA